MDRQNNEERRAETRLANCQTIPVLPETARLLLEMSTDDFVPLDRLTAVIERDPAISTRLIGLANSAFFSPPQPVHCIRQAVIGVLGLDLTRGVAVGMACADAFDTSCCPSFDEELFWQRALRRSQIARELCLRADEESLAGACAMAGMAKDIGVLAAAHIWPVEMQTVLTDNERTLGSRMYAQFSFTHRALTRALLRTWELPDLLIGLAGGYSAVLGPGEASMRAAEIIMDEDEAEACVAKLGDGELALDLPTILALQANDTRYSHSAGSIA